MLYAIRFCRIDDYRRQMPLLLMPFSMASMPSLTLCRHYAAAYANIDMPFIAAALMIHTPRLR